MPRRNQNQNQNQNQNNSITPIMVPGIKFTYSENFNKVTELSTENYLSWKTSILHFLDMNNLIDYILTEKIVKIKVNKIENFEDYLIDKINPTLVYSKNTNPIDVKMDNITKWVILNSIGDNTKKVNRNKR